MSNFSKLSFLFFFLPYRPPLLPSHWNWPALCRCHHPPSLTPLSGHQSPPLFLSLPSFSLFPSLFTSPPPRLPATHCSPLINGKTERHFVGVITGRSSQLSPAGNLTLSPFPFPISFSFLLCPHHHRHHCQRPMAAATSHQWKGKERGREVSDRRGLWAAVGHALVMVLTVVAVVMSRKGRKKRGRERNREKRERGKIAVRRELCGHRWWRRQGDSRFWCSGRGGWVILEKKLELLFECMKSQK